MPALARGRFDALLVEGEKIRALLGVDQIVGVLHALGDALVGQERAQPVAGHETGQLVIGDLGVDGHGRKFVRWSVVSGWCR
jgi:hypothetical protein